MNDAAKDPKKTPPKEINASTDTLPDNSPDTPATSSENPLFRPGTNADSQ